MNIIMVTPAAKRSRSGNRATAERWEAILRGLGHRVRVSTTYPGGDFDLMVALHAWRSAQAVQTYRERFAQRPLIVALTGTDLYRFIDSHPRPTLRSIELADRLVTLHDLAHEAIPQRFRTKVRVIHQSAKPLARRLPPNKTTFDVCISGHLRDEKDPLRAALAARELPSTSRIRVLHYGKAHDDSWAERGRVESERNPRYRWFGEVPHWQVRRAYARSRVMVLSSRMEGGANVVSEAVVAELPIIASEIAGSVGLLGRDYSGYYPVEDTDALRAQLLRAERDPKFLDCLRNSAKTLVPLFQPAREASSWAALLRELCGADSR